MGSCVAYGGTNTFSKEVPGTKKSLTHLNNNDNSASFLN